MGTEQAHQQFTQDLLNAIQHHQPLTGLQQIFIASLFLIPLPVDWKIKFFDFLYTHDLFKAENYVPVVIILLILFIAVIIGIVLVIKLLQIRYYKNQPTALLFVSPPHNTTQSALSTTQLFNVIHSLGRQISRIDAFLGRKKLISCELVSTRDGGLRYMIRVPVRDVETMEKSLYAYLPGVIVEQVNDYLPERMRDLQGKEAYISEIELANYELLPLQTQTVLSKHDPIAFVTSHMTKLPPGDLIAMHVIVTPILEETHKKIVKQIKKMNELLFSGTDVSWQIHSYKKGFGGKLLGILRYLGYLVIFIKFTLLSLLVSLISRGRWPYLPTYIFFRSRPARKEELTREQIQIQDRVNEKLNDNLFEVTVRLCFIDTGTEDQSKRVRGLLSSFSVFDSAYQHIINKRKLPLLHRLKLYKQFFYFLAKHRLLSNSKKMLLTVSEVASLYHFPYTSTTKTENMVNIKSRVLPAPLSLKQETNSLDAAFAYNSFGGDFTPIGLTKEERQRHVYILGATGTGKSTLMLTMIAKDMQSGKGVCVVDPHGELAEKVLAYVPPERKDDVIYVNPDDIDYPVSLNLLELTPGLSRADRLREKEFIAESVVSLFRKVFAKSSADHAHRIEHILRNTIHTAFTLPNPTLFTLFDLLEDPAFRKKTVRQLTDERLKKFWMNEFDKAGNWQQVKMVAPITAKIGRFLFSPIAKSILENPRSTVNIEQAMNEGKIVICNLAKGKLGEDTSEVLGILLLNKIELATLKRARLKKQDRKDFYLYVDEFQNFATPSFVNMLSEARKYHLSVTLAEQTTSQIADKNLVDIIFANVCSVVCFRTANTADEERILPIFAPYVQKHEIINLPSYHFYMKIASLTPQEPFSGETIQDDDEIDETYVNELIDLSREKYAVAPAETNDATTTAKTTKSRKKVKKQKTKSPREQSHIKQQLEEQDDDEDLP